MRHRHFFYIFSTVHVSPSIPRYCKVWSLQATNNMSLSEHIICSLGVFFGGEKIHVERQACFSPSLGSISSTQAQARRHRCWLCLLLETLNWLYKTIPSTLFHTPSTIALCFSLSLSLSLSLFLSLSLSHALFEKKMTKTAASACLSTPLF